MAVEIVEAECAEIMDELYGDHCLCKRLSEMVVDRADNLGADSESATTLYALAAILLGIAVRLEANRRMVSTWMPLS